MPPHNFIIPILSLGRAATGALTLISPSLASKGALTPYATAGAASAMPWRLFGARDFTLGLYLWLSRNKDPTTALKLGLAIDCIDVLSTTACYLEDGLPWQGGAALGGAAAALVLLGWASLRSFEKAALAAAGGVALK